MQRHRLSPEVTLRVFPSLHSCTWILTDAESGEEEHGHSGLTQDERTACPGLVQRITEVVAAGGETAQVLREHVLGSTGSMSDGGPLAFLIETPDQTIFWQDTSGCWTGTFDGIEADVAILAASGRPNVDGEPIQGSMAQFIAMEAKALGARQVYLGHHDNWMPPVTQETFDMAPLHAELARQAPGATLAEIGYLGGTVISE